MREIFEKVLNKIVVPNFDNLVQAKVKPAEFIDKYFLVAYYYTPPPGKLDFSKIREETKSIYYMLGKSFDYEIRFFEYKS